MLKIIKFKPPYIRTLYREVNHQRRYYILSIYKTLFGEYILERKYGSVKNKRPTGTKINHFKTLSEALVACSKKVEEKLNRGYKIL